MVKEKRKYVRKQVITVNPSTSAVSRTVVPEKVINKRTLADDSFRAVVAGCKFVIEKNIPLASATRAGVEIGSKYPFKHMKVGDSFLAKLNGKDCIPNTLYAAAYSFRKKDNKSEVKFTIRKTVEGIRCWRVA